MGLRKSSLGVSKFSRNEIFILTLFVTKVTSSVLPQVLVFSPRGPGPSLIVPW